MANIYFYLHLHASLSHACTVQHAAHAHLLNNTDPPNTENLKGDHAYLVFIFFANFCIACLDKYRIFQGVAQQSSDDSAGSAGTPDVAIAYGDED